jgi:signal transduction histidine kinase
MAEADASDRHQLPPHSRGVYEPLWTKITARMIGGSPSGVRSTQYAWRGPSGDAKARDTERVLRTLTWIGRLVGLVLVGVAIFVQPARHGQLSVEIAAFSVVAVTIAVWAILDWPSVIEWPARIDRPAGTERPATNKWLPYLLSVVTVSSAIGSITKTGGTLIFLAMTAAVSAGADTDLATGWTIVGLGAVAIEVTGLAYGSSSWDTTLGYPLVLLVGLLVGRNRHADRVQAEQSAALLVKVRQLQEEQKRTAAFDERTRIAREIHDVLAHSLGALGVQIQAARAVLGDQGDVGRTIELLDQAQRMATDGLRETRRAVLALRTDTPPLPEGLAELGAAHQLRHQAPVTLHVNGQPRPLSPDAGLALTRTAQEALVNTAKHAPNQPVDVHLDYDDAHTTLAVINPLERGQGQSTDFATLNGGYGLAGLRERLLLIDGTLDAGPDGDRWVVTAQVPVSEPR